MTRPARAGYSAFAFLLFFAAACLAQIGTTSLAGVVTDRSGAAVPGAAITLVNPSQGTERKAVTNNSGEYRFLSVPPGTYNLTVEKQGFQTAHQNNLALLVNNPATSNIALEVGSVTEQVEVTSQAAAINTTDASLGNAIGEHQIKQLPLESRNVPDLLSLQAGVVYTGNRPDIDTGIDTRSGSVNGARSDQSNVTLDGIAVNDKGGHAFTSVLPVTLDSVQEFRVTTTNYNADQGSTSGAQVALVTKSGTNSFHGSAYEYNRNTYTSANDYFVKAAQIDNCLGNGTPLSDPSCNKAPKLIRNIFGGSLGGPIKKDRFYFFGNFEATRRAEAQSQTDVVPSATMRDGIIQYLCADATNPSCQGGSVTGLSGKSYTVQPGYYALSPGTIAGMDPLHIGPNQPVLQYLNTWPAPNSSACGDGFNYA